MPMIKPVFYYYRSMGKWCPCKADADMLLDGAGKIRGNESQSVLIPLQGTDLDLSLEALQIKYPPPPEPV